jgi:hypothetical protein
VRRSPIHPRAWLGIAALILLGTALLPAAHGSWVNSIGGLALRLIAPASHPISMLSRIVIPAERSRTPPDDPEMLALVRDREEFLTLWLREQEETSRLRRTIAELQRGDTLPDLQLHQLVRPVTGGSSEGTGGVLTVRSGTAEGVEKNAVATTAGVQLVGRVVHADSRLATVRLINNRRVREKIRGVVIAESGERGAICLLTPLAGGDGILQGQVETSSTPAAVGQIVRLDDEEWPRHAQMLIIGRIEHVEQGKHGWQFIRVRPTVDLDRVKEVVLRFTPGHEFESAPPITPMARRGAP